MQRRAHTSTNNCSSVSKPTRRANRIFSDTPSVRAFSAVDRHDTSAFNSAGNGINLRAVKRSTMTSRATYTANDGARPCPRIRCISSCTILLRCVCLVALGSMTTAPLSGSKYPHWLPANSLYKTLPMTPQNNPATPSGTLIQV